MIIYETAEWNREIKKITVLRETTHCYFVLGYMGRENKFKKDPARHHASYAEARAALIKREEHRVLRSRYALEIAERDLATVRLLVPEVEP